MAVEKHDGMILAVGELCQIDQFPLRFAAAGRADDEPGWFKACSDVFVSAQAQSDLEPPGKLAKSRNHICMVMVSATETTADVS